LPEEKSVKRVLRKQVCKDEIQQLLNNLEDIYFCSCHFRAGYTEDTEGNADVQCLK